ncbi:serine/threonine-protein kinase SMG1-like [Vigna unguiculata]|uniref:serine/threonine-protein kinase SMG1-like n=1 Tax=Vigna unguiculata TaxID=3917 RepID=UPI0010170E1D|nr:serine/threonine-protein kinase SMG1-like [Vigna unguiculata]XP_027910250.1 serine/threonine-protein kinase SMG1-like [Vigna unguiculata]XP_027910252.1 serine/threonine-protein kinase SMG1-like [Vigna unguiculata]
MQGIHQHQQHQHLAALVSAALPKDDSDDDPSPRLAAIHSLHRAILHPHNSLLLSHSATFLAQAFSQLLSDKCYEVRQAAVTAYGALCAVAASIPVASNGRQNLLMLVDRFIGWALPSLSTAVAVDGTKELALEGLREFLNVGGTDRYALPILKACQVLLEDERTSLALLHRLIGVITLISLKFMRCFQPHFPDIVDLLLGWALMPDLAQSDRRVILDSFLQFQKHWVGSLPMSLRLLTKFLGDMEVLLHDGTPGTPQQFRRLLALLSCFSTILQSTASGLLEMNLLEQICEPLSALLPRLLRCLSMIGQKFGWSDWIEDSWKCLTLLAEILQERFSSFYPLAVDILFQSLEFGVTVQRPGLKKISSFQVHGVLKTNLQLLSLQKLGLLPLSVKKLLKFDASVSQLRLHPNHLVTGSSAATYVFLLQHANTEVVDEAVTSLIEELELLKSLIGNNDGHSYEFNCIVDTKTFSKAELLALIKFDLKVLLACVCMAGDSSLIGQKDIASLYLRRLEKLESFITKQMNPFELPIQDFMELQITVVKTLERINSVDFLIKCSVREQNCEKTFVEFPTEKEDRDDQFSNERLAVITEHLEKYSKFVVKAFHVSSPLAIKLVVLDWGQKFCESVMAVNKVSSISGFSYEACEYAGVIMNLVFSLLGGTFEREQEVRSHVAITLEMFMQAKLLHPVCFYPLAEVILEKLGDPTLEIRDAYVRLLAHILPTTIYTCGLYDYGRFRPVDPVLGNSSKMHWKQLFALKQLPLQLHSQHLVSILSYISQRWKVPLSSWIQRLIHSCQSSKDAVLSLPEETGVFGANSPWLDVRVDEDILEKICSVNNLAGAWWAVQEAARYCIATRLRTNLGGPTQTFAALERMLLDIAHLLQLDNEQSDGNLSMIGSSGAHLLPMRLLLDFVEALKKNVYNAYEGSVILPPATRQSTLFFRANKKVCEDWFSRICEPMMNAGLAVHCNDAVIQYCTLRLQELKNLSVSTLKDKSRTQVTDNLHNIRGRYRGDVLKVLRDVSLALCKSSDPESLIGLQKWVSITFSLLGDENQSFSEGGTVGPLSWISGLIYQARGEYENAAAHFTHLLQTEESLSSLGSDGIQFVIARIIESYTAVSDWRSLETWLLELQQLRAKHTGRSYSGALTMAGNEVNAIHALARFDEGDYQAAWSSLDLTPKSNSELTLDPKIALQRSEQMLLQSLLFLKEEKSDKVLYDLQKARSMLEEPLSVLPLDGLAEATPLAIQLHCIFLVEENCKLKTNHEKTKQLPSILNSLESLPSSISKIRQDCNLWLKVLRVYKTISPSSPVTLKFCINLHNLARKQNNLLLANRLNNYIKDHVFACPEERHRNLLVLNLQYESILLQYAENKFEDAFTNLWSFLHPCMFSSKPSIISDVEERILKAKACLKLSDWLRRDYSDWSPEGVVLQMAADFDLAESSPHGKDGSKENLSCKSNLGSIIEEIVGTTTKLSSRICPTMGKSWISYASWCFKQARDSLHVQSETILHSCSFSSILVPEILPDRFKLTKDEVQRIKSLVLCLFQDNIDMKGFTDEQEERGSWLDSAELSISESPLQKLVWNIVNVIETAAGASGAENSGGECLSDMVSSQLRICLLSTNFELGESDISSALDNFVDIWWSLRRRRVSLFGHAAHGYIQYLSYSSSRICHSQVPGSEYETLKQKAGSYTLKATLYILHILLNYGVELKDTLESALLVVPLLPWQEVTPQLFARISSHPEQVIRKQLEGLLTMLAKQSPYSIVYPTLVDVNAYEEKPSEELHHVLGCLRELYPRLVQDVQLMINELGNVTVLWEELWLSTLQDLHTDVMRRINLLKEEAARIAENVTLSQNEKSKINSARYSAMMAPIVVALERRLASTSRKPETPHEAWFQEEYKDQLKSAILSFKIPPVSSAAIGDVWRPFDSIAASLASYQRKSSVSLGEVAPHLALLSSSDVPMPGLEKQMQVPDSDKATDHQGVVTIASFHEQVTILSTKTKPKKLGILGSDGQKYTYLLKGREDLRLDARIMQLLQAINGFLHSSSSACSNSLTIRYYSVTPISGRAGLIQWAGNVVSIYSVFKSWQTRVQLAQFLALGSANTKSSAPPPVPRPSDMFYGKIIPALKEKGIKRVISRRDWPHEVKCKVLLDLMKEVPRHLLYQELWCASEGYKAFSSKLKRYTGSVAAMSMVGHVLGLGDRHLDNILIDFCSGDIVHIDYNVCFDKGQRLKVPEIVPFRLTQIIEAALGLTGIEGSFRSNCETVIGVLRKNKDVLLMLLEVFVWDPLVEWTRGDFHDEAAIGGEERKGMELAVSLSLFASRVQEIRVPLQEHHDQLLTSLPAVESALERFGDVLNKYELASSLYCRADQERSSLILHETSAKSIVAEATSNSEKIRASFEIQAREFAQAKAMVAEKAQEAMTWAEQHGRILDALRCNLIPEINTSFKLNNMGAVISLTSAVIVAGVPLTVVPEPTQAQCQDIDREVSQFIAELGDGLTSATASLQAYSLALQRILPLNYLSTSAVHNWAQVLQLSINALSSDMLSLARRQASELIAKFHVDNSDSIKCSHDDLCFRVEKYAVEIEKLQKECAEIESSIGSESESKTKDRLLYTFMKFMQSIGLLRKEVGISSVQSKYDSGMNNARPLGELEEEREKAFSILNIAVSSLYNEVKHKILNIYNDTSGGRNQYNMLQNDSGTIFSEFEEQVEKCNLVTEFVHDLCQFIGKDIPSIDINQVRLKISSESNWVSIFKNILISCKGLVSQMTEVVLPDVIRAAVSLNSEVMDAFGLISQVRGSIETALEQLVEVEMERVSLNELEQNYFVKVGLITEQQLALEEAAVKGRDHLSWEEAEELASQEEACRAKLDQLHQTWNQRDVRTSSLTKRETDIKNALVSVNCQFQSLVGVEEERELHILRSKALLASLVKPFLELESIDILLSTTDGSVAMPTSKFHTLTDLINSGNSLSEYVWKVGRLLNNHSFFIWKIGVIDSFLDACIHDVASSVEQNLGFDQSLNFMKKKLEIQLQKHIGHYLKERVAPSLLACLDKENEYLKQLTESSKELALDQGKKDGAVKKVLLMLEEYCNAHETARAAKSAASVMKKQVNELKEALRKTALEVVQMEWMHDVSLNPSYNRRIRFEKYLDTDDSLYTIILNLNRSELLDNVQSAVSKITTSMDCLQSCERNSLMAEGQLERAMAWACGNSSNSGNTSTTNSGIPPEFHEHIKNRRQILWESREKASDIVKLCVSVLEFEASRDGYLLIPDQPYPFRSSVDAKTWQQVYLKALTRLDVTFHSYSRTEQEWKLAQCTVEAASNGLYTATNELCIASVKAKSASGDLQNTVLSMRDCAYEASVALSAFARISRIQTALTSESGSMLEEVLAITEDIHDVYNLGKEAAGVHLSLMEGLSKANAILFPLESVLSKDVAAMADAIDRESETKKEISHIHGQAIYQSYCLRIREACQTFKPLVPSLMLAVKGLYSLLTRLARTANVHAGNLHKALEGIGESQEVKSVDTTLSRSDGGGGEAVEFDGKEGEGLSRSEDGETDDFVGFSRLSLEDKGWISPPDSICCTSSESDMTAAEVSLPDSLNDSAGNKDQLSQGSSRRNPTGLMHTALFSQTELEEISPFGLSQSSPVETDLNGSGSVKSTNEATEHSEAIVLLGDKTAAMPANSQNPANENIDKFDSANEPLSAKEVKNATEHRDAPNVNANTRVGRGKNAYALSVLRRVEMKIDGRDISESREIDIAEQVDYLLKQATSVDNLCNMYEGWTPWI